MHIAGELNIEADNLSRKQWSGEWSLSVVGFRKITAALGGVDLDAFAAENNRWITRY